MIHERHSDRLEELIKEVLKELMENAEEFSSNPLEQEANFYKSILAFSAKLTTTIMVDKQ